MDRIWDDGTMVQGGSMVGNQGGFSLLWDDGTMVQGGSMVGNQGGFSLLYGASTIKHNNAGLTAMLVRVGNALQLRVLEAGPHKKGHIKKRPHKKTAT